MDRGTLKVKLSCPVRPNQQIEHFTDDLAVWVVLFGPPGGEAATASTV